MRRLLLALLILTFPSLLWAARPQVSVVSVNGTVNPVTVSYLLRNLEAVSRRGDSLFLVELDTPGGLDSAMREAILNTISNPDLAYLLMLAGILGIFFELSTPGAILPGVIGGISLILAFFAFQTLPVNYAGVLLILLALILFIAEIKIVSHGILAIGAVISLILGSLLLFPSSEPGLRVSFGVILATVLVTTVFFGVVVTKGVEAYRQKPATGKEGMLGECGTALTDLMPAGKVFVRGEYWNAVSCERIMKGESVEVTAVQGLQVTVKKILPSEVEPSRHS
jgi:membrane-bound serine protease (ClpP class)